MKKKVFSVTLVAILVALISVNGSLAYFTDNDIKTNVFTMGKVDIDITEKADGDLDGDGTPDTGIKAGTELKEDPTDTNKITGYAYDDVLPTQTLHKEVTINLAVDNPMTADLNEACSDSWIAAKVTFPTVLVKNFDYNEYFGSFLDGGVCDYTPEIVYDDHGIGQNYEVKRVLKDGDKIVAYAMISNDSGITTIKFYFNDIYSGKDNTKAKEITLFKTVSIDKRLTQDDFAGVFNSNRSINMTVKAYAIQADGFDTIADAAAELNSLIDNNP